MLVFLPDDPAISAESRLTFTKEIDALRYFVTAFNDFHQCLERIAISLGFRPTALDEQLDTTHLRTLDDGIRQTLGLWVEDSDRNCDRARSDRGSENLCSAPHPNTKRLTT